MFSWKREIPGPADIEYTDWPRETSLPEYARAAQEVVELVERTTRNASVYQVGGVTAPGISDLDFIVVANDRGPQADLDQWGKHAGAFSPQSQYILDNKPLIVNPRLWNSLPLLHNFQELRHLSGPVLPPPSSAGTRTAVSHLFDEVERRLFVSQKLERYLLKGSVHVRATLKKLAKSRLDAKVLAEFGIENAAWSEFSDAVSRLRQDWFSLDRLAQTDTLYRLLSAHARIDAEIILEISKLIVQGGMRFPESTRPGSDIVGAFDFGKLFVADYQVDFRLKCLAGSHRISGELTSMLPATFMLPILIYTSRSPTLRDVFQGRLTAFGDLPDVSRWDLQPGITDRIGILDEYSDFINQRGYGWGLFFNMWNFPKRSREEYQRYWQAASGPLERSADILPFLLRKRLEGAHPHLARLAGRTTTEAYLQVSHTREKIGPVRRLPGKGITWLRQALGAQSGS